MSRTTSYLTNRSSESFAHVFRMLDCRPDARMGWRAKATGPNLRCILLHDPDLKGRFRLNLLSEGVELDGQPLNDVAYVRLRLDIAERYGAEFSTAVVGELSALTARDNAYHPVCRYLSELSWDGRRRTEQFLVSHLGAEDTPLNRALSRRWFIGAVARVMGRGLKPVKLDTMLVLVGRQGALKSTAFAELASPEWFADTPLDLSKKDAYSNVRGVWLYEFAELESVRKADSLRVKAFLSASTDRYRPPYARQSLRSHRQVVFVGTTNDHSILTDPTGSRRFWPVSVEDIDLESIKMDRDQLWAEAVHEWRNGEQWWLDDCESAQLRSLHALHTAEDPWAAALARWSMDAGNAALARSGMDIGALLSSVIGQPVAQQHRRDEMRMAAVLQAAGWSKRRTRSGNNRAVLWFPEGR